MGYDVKSPMTPELQLPQSTPSSEWELILEPELDLDLILETELEPEPELKQASAPEVESLPLAKGPFLDHLSLV